MRFLILSCLLLTGCDAFVAHDCRIWASGLDNYEQCEKNPNCKLSPDDFRIKKNLIANMAMNKCEDFQPNGGGAR